MYNICDVLLDKSRFNLTTLPGFDIPEYYKSFKPITTTIWKACNTEIGRNTLSSMNCYRYLLQNATSILYKILSNIDISYNVHCTRQYLRDVYHVRTVTDIFYEYLEQTVQTWYKWEQKYFRAWRRKLWTFEFEEFIIVFMNIVKFPVRRIYENLPQIVVDIGWCIVIQFLNKFFYSHHKNNCHKI